VNRGIDILGKDSSELVHFGVWVFVFLCVDLWVCGLGNNDMNTSMLQRKVKWKIQWHFAIIVLEMGYLVIDLVKYLTHALTKG